MITITKNIQISGGTSPYTFNFESSVPCVTFVSSVVTNNILTINIEADESCFTLEPEIIVSGTDKNGCTFTNTFTLTNPCADLTVSEISFNQGLLRFHITANTPNCSSVNFDWSITDNYTIHSRIDSAYESILTLSYTGADRVLANDIIACSATDCNGCSQTKFLNFSVCQPQMSNANIFAACRSSSSNIWETGLLTLPSLNTCGGLNFDTANFNLPSNISVQKVNDRFRFTINQQQTQTQVYTITYNIRSNQNVLSNTANIVIGIEPCATSQPLIQNEVTTVPNDAVENDIITADISGNITSTFPIDWSTFTVLTNVPYTGTINLYCGGNQGVIEYTVPATPVTESVQYTINDTMGNTSNVATHTWVYQDEMATINDITTCTRANTLITINALSTSTGDFNLSTFQITTPPTLGTFTLAGSTISYTAPANYTGDQTFNYSVRDVFNQLYTGTVTIEVLNPGTTTTLNVCTNDNYNLYNLLGANVTEEGTWSAIAGSPTLPASYNSPVLVNTNGTFIWRYTVTNGTCSYTADVTIVKINASVLTMNECATALTFIPPVTLSYYQTTVSALGEDCPKHQRSTLSAVALPSTWSSVVADHWYKVNLEAVTTAASTITIRFQTSNAAVFNPATFVQIAMYETCIGLPLNTLNEFLLNTSSASITLPTALLPNEILFRVGANTFGSFRTELLIGDIE